MEFQREHKVKKIRISTFYNLAYGILAGQHAPKYGFYFLKALGIYYIKIKYNLKCHSIFFLWILFYSIITE